MGSVPLEEVINKDKTALIFSLLSAAVVFACLGTTAVAQLRESELFEKAYGSYRSGDPEKAVELFEVFLKEFPASSARDSVLFWEAKAFIGLNKTKEAARLLAELEEKFPDSPFRAFAIKEIELIKQSGPGAGDKKTDPATVKEDKREIEPAVSGHNFMEYEERIKDLERLMAGSAAKNQLLEKGLAKAIEDKNSVEDLLEELKKKQDAASKDLAFSGPLKAENASLLEERNSLETRLREKDSRIASLLMDRDAYSEKFRAAAAEKEEAVQKSLREAEGREKEVGELAALLNDREKKLAEAGLSAKKASEADAAFEARLKEEAARYQELQARYQEVRDLAKKTEEEKAAYESRLKRMESRAGELELIKNEHEALKAESAVIGAAARQTEAGLKKNLAETELLRKLIKEGEARERDLKELAAKLSYEEQGRREQENLSRETGGLLRKAEEEKALCESRVKEEGHRRLEQDGIIEEQDKKYRGLMKETEVLADKAAAEKAACEARLKDDETKIAALGKAKEDHERQLKHYEEPVVRIAGQTYSLLQIMEDNLLSARALSKMKVAAVPWRDGNSYADFITEQILFNKAADRDIKEESPALESIAETYSLTAQERMYVKKYLAVAGLVKNKMAGFAVNEKEIRNYYEDNKKDYLVESAEKTVMALVIPFTGQDEIDKALLATEIQEEAAGGRTFEDLAGPRPGSMSVKEMGYDELPLWIKEKIQDLKPGEVSTVISTDNRHLILQTGFRGPVYRKYEDVRADIRNKLAASGRNLGVWLDEIRKEAEEVR